MPAAVTVADLTKTYLTKETADATYQALDADLTALAGLTGTGAVERTGDTDNTAACGATAQQPSSLRLPGCMPPQKKETVETKRTSACNNCNS
jgi:hypothetical protein